MAAFDGVHCPPIDNPPGPRGDDLLPLQGGGREGDGVLADRLRVLNEAHPHLYARRGAVSFLHPFGGENVFLLPPHPLEVKGVVRVDLPVQLDFSHATAVSVKPF
jgi:hypothetical protein